MSVSEAEHAALLLEHARLKLRLLDCQAQFLQVQSVLVRQEIEKYENELAIVESQQEQTA